MFPVRLFFLSLKPQLCITKILRNDLNVASGAMQLRSRPSVVFRSSHNVIPVRPLLHQRHLARRVLVTATAGAAALSAPQADYQYSYASLKNSNAPPVPELPSPPKSTSPLAVAHYLARLAVGERQLLWRVVLAFVFM